MATNDLFRSALEEFKNRFTSFWRKFKLELWQLPQPETGGVSGRVVGRNHHLINDRAPDIRFNGELVAKTASVARTTPAGWKLQRRLVAGMATGPQAGKFRLLNTRRRGRTAFQPRRPFRNRADVIEFFGTAGGRGTAGIACCRRRSNRSPRQKPGQRRVFHSRVRSSGAAPYPGHPRRLRPDHPGR